MRSESLDPIRSSDWNPRTARHLLNRAGFGVPEERYRALAELTPREAVDSLVDYDRVSRELREPDYLIPSEELQDRRRAAQQLPEEERRKQFMEFQRRERENMQRLKAWWVDRALNTPRPLEEKMALFWHGHFATSAQKVQSSWWNYHLNTVFRTYATGNFKTLALEVGQAPAMLRYLDNNQNRKRKPNENWARELMELFTLGTGNYTERDIKAAARAFTGWTFDELAFNYNPRIHDTGVKTFLGKSGNFDGWDIIDIIFEQPAAAEFITRKLWTFFAYADPPDTVVRPLAEEFRGSGYELRPLLKRIFLSQAFYSDRAMGTQIKSPVQFIVQLADQLQLEPAPLGDMARAAQALGQDLFYPPNVKGWDGGRAWINANSLLLRYNLPRNLLVASANAKRAAESPGMMDGDMMEMGMQQKPWEQLREYMRELPQMERQKIRQRIARAKNDRERYAVVMETLNSRSLDGIWDPHRALGDRADGRPRDFVEDLAARFLSVPLAAEQTRVLARSLRPGSPTDGRVRRDELAAADVNATLHLLLSMAEYQLC